jgi:hypothetical protein
MKVYQRQPERHAYVRSHAILLRHHFDVTNNAVFIPYTQVNRFFSRACFLSLERAEIQLQLFWSCGQGTRRGLWKGFTFPATNFLSFIIYGIPVISVHPREERSPLMYSPSPAHPRAPHMYCAATLTSRTTLFRPMHSGKSISPANAPRIGGGQKLYSPLRFW